MDTTVLIIFSIVYLGMFLGSLPFLAMDRTGIALLGAIAMVAFGRVSAEHAWAAIDVPTICLLFGLMIVSAQFRLAGFYTRLTRKLAAVQTTPPMLLGIIIAVTGMLSALVTNDVVCLAIAPLLIEGCAMRRLNPKPFLLGLAAGANVGSAATLIGNPQNILIGQKLHLDFARYLLDGGVPAILGLMTRGKWDGETPYPIVEAPPFSAWHSCKAGVVLAVLIGCFIFTPIPREVLTLAAAGLLLLSRKLASHKMLELVDWQLLVLFAGLFVVTFCLSHPIDGHTNALTTIMDSIRSVGIDPNQPVWLFVLSSTLSNLVSNVPAVMLLLPDGHAPTHPQAGPILALAPTLTGNLLVVSSIANIIVIDQARQHGVVITWKEHIRLGVPITIVTLSIAAVWLWVMSMML